MRTNDHTPALLGSAALSLSCTSESAGELSVHPRYSGSMGLGIGVANLFSHSLDVTFQLSASLLESSASEVGDN